ncbi:hypothetical protein Taro_010109 [Colocasia esculenta]|uniref:Uncharacterized protein n=1 Tax=Colocasia esculenta TaxID=4460 RepID=A0A843U249_COLES|nr:hypothetical protein [Colocasia esculenta]
MGYVAFLKAAWPMSPSHRVAPDAGVCRLLEGDTPTLAFWFPRRHKVCRLLSSVGLKPGRPSPSPSLAPLLSPSLSLTLSELPAVLGCLPRVEAAVLWRVTLRSCRGRVRAVRCEEEMAKPTRRPQRVRSSRGGDRAYVAFSVQRQPCGGHNEQSYGVSDREYFPYRVSFSFASALPFVGDSSQQRQGARRAEETGR